jgi:hypothetical protein
VSSSHGVGLDAPHTFVGSGRRMASCQLSLAMLSKKVERRFRAIELAAPIRRDGLAIGRQSSSARLSPD